jgi:DNA processing protein
MLGQSLDLAQGGAICLGPADADFPLALRKMTSTIWLRGQVRALRISPRVTVVGSRDASARGLARARSLGAALAERGALVVSGGALGIDGAAHAGALDAGGYTCAVLGTGVDQSYPARHGELFTAIARSGCLLSMLPPGSPPLPRHFPQRNELMAALADLVVVIEARIRSGTEYTARAAHRLGRPVVCFADSPGTTALLHKGAQPVGSVGEVLSHLGLQGADLEPIGTHREESLPLSPASEQLLCALAQNPQDLGELCARTGLSAADCAAAVIELALHGHCSRLSGGRYIGHAPTC